MQYASLQTVRRSLDRPPNVYKVEYEVGDCEVIGVVSAIFLLPVLAAAASEYDFSPFFDVSAPPCARSSTGNAQSAIAGSPLVGVTPPPHDSDHADCSLRMCCIAYAMTKSMGVRGIMVLHLFPEPLLFIL